MYAELRRLYDRQVGAKIREVLSSRIPSLRDKSCGINHRIKAKASIFEATCRLTGCQASLRELQRLVGRCPPSGLALVRGDLSAALILIEEKLGSVRDVVAAQGKAAS